MLKIGDKVSIAGLSGVHTVELIPDGEPYPLRVTKIRFTKFGEFRSNTGDVHLTLVERPDFKVGDKVRIKGDHELSVGILRPNNKPDRDKYPLMVFGKTFNSKGQMFIDEEPQLELVEEPFELHDKVTIKGFTEPFILQLNDLKGNEDYPFRARSSDGKSFGVTREGKTDISVDIVLIDRPSKLSVMKVVDGVEVLDVGNYRLHYKSDLLCERVKKSKFVELTIERGDDMLWGTCKIGDNLITTTGVSEEDLKTNMSKVIFDFEGLETFKYLTTWVEAIPKEDCEPTEAQLETFTKGMEHAEKLIKGVEVRSVLHPLDSALPIKCQVVEGGKLPTYAHDGDAGMDLYVRAYERADDEHIKYFLGIKLDLDEGYAAFIFPRSSVYKSEQILSNCVGVVDSGYKGEISAVFKKHTSTQFMVGDRACQMVIMPVPKVRLVEVEELRDSVRGSNGYGSSGK